MEDTPGSASAVGEVVGSYKLESLLGVGGMGSVYKAAHVLLGRPTAVKLLDPSFANDEEYVSRFFHEAKVVNDIRHPNIIDIIDFVVSEEPRRVAYVMELLVGQPLSNLIRTKGRLSAHQATNVTLQLSSALQAVHEIGVIHRDLKPDNVFITGDYQEGDLSEVPSVKVLDFGIAKFQNSVGHRTRTGVAMGTPAYMAPEQLAGDPVSPATDVYALAELFYEMLSGEKLFRGTGMEALRQKAMGQIPTLKLPEFAGREVAARLIKNGLSDHATERPTLVDFQNELRLILYQGGEEQTAPPGPNLPVEPPPTLAQRVPVEAMEVPQRSEVSAPLADPGLRAASQTGAMSGAFPTPAPRRSRGPVILGLVAVFLGAVGVAYFMGREIDPAASPVQTEPLTQKVAPVAPKPAPEETLTPIAPTLSRIIYLASQPKGAEVRDAETKQKLGVTPLEVTIAPSATERRVELSARGYHRKELTLLAGDDDVDVELVRARRAPAPKPKPTARAKPKPVEKQPETDKPAKAPRPRPLRRNEVTQW